MLPANSCLPQQKRAMRGVLFRCLPTWKFAARRSVLCYVASTGAVQARRRRRQTTRNSEPDMDSSTSLETRGLVNSQETSNSAKNVLSGRAPAAEAFSKARGWVVFSDLHCSSKTIDTALEVLQLVRKEATARNAGVLFLGECCCLCTCSNCVHTVAAHLFLPAVMQINQCHLMYNTADQYNVLLESSAINTVALAVCI
eukprot:GHRR01030911.1.p1 GENE.GHRR01030911.1~~GHRR01030911.1.p1  ORF type:complete len:233 (+),score=26.31 GHRR01030911.1:104-700(+)